MSRPGPTPRDELDGLPPGARVVLVLSSGERLAALLLACLDRELVAVPLAPRTEPWQVTEIVERVDASVVVTADGVTRTGRPAAHPDAAGLALIMFTSGSTGVPKGVMLPRDAVLGNARRTAALHRFGPDRPHATCLPLYHCNALVMSLIGTHLTGTPLVLHSRFDPEAYLADLAAKEVATASVVPALLPDLLDAAPPWPPGLDYLITAAAPLTADLARRFHDVYGPRLRQGYGLTELVNFSFTTPELGPAAWTAEYLDRHPPVGAPLPGTELRIESGEVRIRSADRMRGYWGDPAATAATLTDDGWLRTGDLGRVRDGLLVLEGRGSERIDRGGEKFYPLDVERGWRRAGLTGTFAAVGVPDDVLGHEIGLVTADASDDVVATVRRITEQGPRRPGVVQFGGFDATATGKPRRSAMGRAMAAGRASPRPGAAGAHERLADRVDERLPAGSGPSTRIDLRTATVPGPLGRPGQADRPDTLDQPALPDQPGRPDQPGQTGWHDQLGLSDLPGLLRAVPADRPVLILHGGPADPVPRDGDRGRTSGAAEHRPPDYGPDRWQLVTALRDAGRTAVGAAVLRAGRHDRGGVVWAR